jgi:hypothetical protein
MAAETPRAAGLTVERARRLLDRRSFGARRVVAPIW